MTRLSDLVEDVSGSLQGGRSRIRSCTCRKDALKANHDFRCISGRYIVRHHVMGREESFRIPLKCIDVVRYTQTNINALEEKAVDDYWNVDGEPNLGYGSQDSPFWLNLHLKDHTHGQEEA